jgi:hypothetical protein
MTGPYARVYHSIVDDPKFERVYGNDKALATWLRMLLVADAMYPTSAPMPHRNPTVQLLIDVGLVVEKSGNRYAIKGLQAERERRSASARNAAAVRWQSKGNADAMPRRDEQSKDEHTASQANGTSPFMGWRSKPGTHSGQHPDCAVCAPLRPKATA